MSIAAFAGGGLDAASRLIEDPATAAQSSLAENLDVPDDPRTFNGLFCRWAHSAVTIRPKLLGP